MVLIILKFKKYCYWRKSNNDVLQYLTNINDTGKIINIRKM